MYKKVETEYTNNNRHAPKRRDKPMDLNLVHDMEYTFADEYYKDLRDTYYEEMMKDLSDED